MTKSISKRAFAPASIGDRIFLFCLCGFMAAFGALWLYTTTGDEALEHLRTRSWLPVSCTITSSEMTSYEDSDGQMVSEAAFTYVYVFGGQEHEGDLYALPSTWRDVQPDQAFVDQHPRGATATCYVDPRDPTWAVLKRGVTWGWGSLIVTLLGSAVMLGGLYGVSRAVWPRRRVPLRVPARPASAPGQPAQAARDASAPVTFVSPGRIRRVLKFFLFAVAFNGFSAGLLAVAMIDDIEGRGILIGALVLFGLIGVGLFGALVHALLGLLNPRVRITLDRAAVRLGDSLSLQWEIQGAARRLDDLRIVLEGVEKATFSHGDGSSTEEHTFLELPLVAMEHPGANGNTRGEAKVAIPTDLMHSFDSGNCEIVWRLRARGVIRRWPDIDDAFTIELLPGGTR